MQGKRHSGIRCTHLPGNTNKGNAHKQAVSGEAGKQNKTKYKQQINEKGEHRCIYKTFKNMHLATFRSTKRLLKKSIGQSQASKTLKEKQRSRAAFTQEARRKDKW